MECNLPIILEIFSDKCTAVKRRRNRHTSIAKQNKLKGFQCIPIYLYGSVKEMISHYASGRDVQIEHTALGGDATKPGRASR